MTSVLKNATAWRLKLSWCCKSFDYRWRFIPLSGDCVDIWWDWYIILKYSVTVIYNVTACWVEEAVEEERLGAAFTSCCSKIYALVLWVKLCTEPLTTAWRQNISCHIKCNLWGLHKPYFSEDCGVSCLWPAPVEYHEAGDFCELKLPEYMMRWRLWCICCVGG